VIEVVAVQHEHPLAHERPGGEDGVRGPALRRLLDVAQPYPAVVGAQARLDLIFAVADDEHDFVDDPRELALSYEFYAYAIRRPAIGRMVEAWFARSQLALVRFFDPATARLVDTFIEGLFTYRGLADEVSGAEEIRRGLRLLCGSGRERE